MFIEPFKNSSTKCSTREPMQNILCSNLNMPLCLLGFLKCRIHRAMKFQPVKHQGSEKFPGELQRLQASYKVVFMPPWRNLQVLHSLGLYFCAQSHSVPLEKNKFSMCLHTYIHTYIGICLHTHIHMSGKAVISEFSSTSIEQSFSYYNCINIIINKK